MKRQYEATVEPSYIKLLFSLKTFEDVICITQDKRTVHIYFKSRAGLKNFQKNNHGPYRRLTPDELDFRLHVIPHHKLLAMRSITDLEKLFKGEDVLYDPTNLVTRIKAVFNLHRRAQKALSNYLSHIFYDYQNERHCFLLHKKMAKWRHKKLNAALAEIQGWFEKCTMKELCQTRAGDVPFVYFGFKPPGRGLIPFDQASYALVRNEKDPGMLKTGIATGVSVMMISLMTASGMTAHSHKAHAQGFTPAMTRGPDNTGSLHSASDVKNIAHTPTIPLGVAIVRTIPQDINFQFTDLRAAGLPVSMVNEGSWEQRLAGLLAQHGKTYRLDNNVVIVETPSAPPVSGVEARLEPSAGSEIMAPAPSMQNDGLPIEDRAPLRGPVLTAPRFPILEEINRFDVLIEDPQPPLPKKAETKKPLTEQSAGLHSFVGAFGGGTDEGGVFGGENVISLTTSSGLGLQLDNAVADVDSKTLVSVKSHFYFRDPETGLIGLTAEWNEIDDHTRQAFGLEAEYHFTPRLTAFGEGGFENIDFDVVGQPNPDESDFYGAAGLIFYPAESFLIAVSGGHIVEQEFANLDIEWQSPFNLSRKLSLFADGTVGSDDMSRFLTGLRFYFGMPDSLVNYYRKKFVRPAIPQALSATAVSSAATAAQQKIDFNVLNYGG